MQTEVVATAELFGKGYSFLSVAGASDSPIAAVTIEQDFRNANICFFGCHFRFPSTVIPQDLTDMQMFLK